MPSIPHKWLGFAALRADRRTEAQQLVTSLYSDWYSRLVGYAVRSLVSIEDAEDVVQDTFTDLYRALVEGKVVNNPKGWTLCAVRRRIIDRRRAEGRHGGPFVVLAEEELGLGDQSVPSLSQGEVGELSLLLAVLSRREQEVLLLRAEALKYREIASELKISVNSVKKLLARGIRKIRQASMAPDRRPHGVKDEADSVSGTLQ
jgi:RNA polymerase sigma-70 factor (ECF subfamily)